MNAGRPGASAARPDRGTRAGWHRWLIAALQAGVGVGLVDAAIAMGRLGERLATRSERLPFALSLSGLAALALVAITAVVCLLAAIARKLPDKWHGAAVQGVAIAIGFGAGFALFSGTAMRHSSGRKWAILATAAFAALIAQTAWHGRDWLLAFARRHGQGVRGALLLASAGLYIAHAFALVRLYPAVHAMAAGAAIATLVVALGIGTAETSPRTSMAVILAALTGGVFGGWNLVHSQVQRALARQRAPVGTYLVRALAVIAPASAVEGIVRDDRAVEGRHLDFRGLDVVLITVDALRADHVGAYGGPAGLTPSIDAMAARGVIVDRVYCTTPHTSYSLASLMTGKYFRGVAALGRPARAHETLAGILGRAGYETAGFYPPAVFAVDGEALGDLRPRAFDFGQHTENYSDAPTRVREVEHFLATVPVERRVFVWVHLFEPHEPYQVAPSARWRTGTSAAARYASEIATVDDAIAALQLVFDRRARRAAWIVTADHGEELGEHGGRFHGTTVYEEQVRVPLVIAAPGVPAVRLPGPASLVDVAPTVLAALGLPRPSRLRGHDLGPAAYGAPWTYPAFASAGADRMLVDGRDKLICSVVDGSCELYDLARDRTERSNLADVRAARTAALRPLLEGWQSSHARFEREPEDPRPAIPPELERAIQGDVNAAPAVAALLGQLDRDTILLALRTLATLESREASVIEALARLATHHDAAIAREAGLALALSSDVRGRQAALAGLLYPDLLVERRAALGLARLGGAEGVGTLARWALDASATDGERDAAIAALGGLHDARTFDAWITLLEDPRVAPTAARMLGELGDARAIPALGRTASTTRYVLTRQNAVLALARLHASDAPARATQAIAAADPLPDPFGVAAAVNEPGHTMLGASGVTAARPALRSAIVLSGPRVRGEVWAVLRIRADRATDGRIADAEFRVEAGDSTVRVPLNTDARRLVVTAGAPITIRAVLVVPRAE